MDAATDSLAPDDLLNILAGGGRRSEVVAGNHRLSVQGENSHTPPIIYSLYRFLSLRGFKTYNKNQGQLNGSCGWRFPTSELPPKKGLFAGWFSKEPKFLPDDFAFVYDMSIGVGITEISLVTADKTKLEALRVLAADIKSEKKFSALNIKVSLESL